VLSGRDLSLSAASLMSQMVFSLVTLAAVVVATVLWFSAAHSCDCHPQERCMAAVQSGCG